MLYKKLATNPTLIICKPDKSNEVVVMNKDDNINRTNKILCKKRNFRKFHLMIIANLTEFRRFLYNLKENIFLKKKLTIELDPSQLLLLHFMVCQNCTKKDTHVGLSWHQMVVTLTIAQCG